MACCLILLFFLLNTLGACEGRKTHSNQKPTQRCQKKNPATPVKRFFQVLISFKWCRRRDLENQRQVLYESQSHKHVGVSVWKRKRASERINERNIDNVITVFFYSCSCYIISTVLMSCQGLWLLDNCVHFSHRAHSKGLLFSINTIFLSGKHRRSHAHYTHKYTHLLILHYASTHSHMHSNEAIKNT